MNVKITSKSLCEQYDGSIGRIISMMIYIQFPVNCGLDKSVGLIVSKNDFDYFEVGKTYELK